MLSKLERFKVEVGSTTILTINKLEAIEGVSVSGNSVFIECEISDSSTNRERTIEVVVDDYLSLNERNPSEYRFFGVHHLDISGGKIRVYYKVLNVTRDI